MFVSMFRSTPVVAALVALISLGSPARPQDALTTSVARDLPQWSSKSAKHILGLPDVKKDIEGTLALSPSGLDFEGPHGNGHIDAQNILSVTNGNERTMKGGTAGKFARKLPYGAGQVIGLSTMGKVDLVTVEFLDARGGYHGAVFSVPNESAAHLSLPTERDMPVTHESVSLNCLPNSPVNTVLVTPATVQEGELPPEYRVLLYEHLIDRLRTAQPYLVIQRSGLPITAPCTTLTLALQVHGFKKGNVSARSNLGPFGMFVGVTSLKTHILVTDGAGAHLVDEDIKASKRGDTESLDVTDGIAKALSKKLKKLNLQPGTTSTAHMSPTQGAQR